MTPGPPPGGAVTAVLGPTNTGKTHLAIERMMAHASGMIGFPLRLLAREAYDRVVAVKGPKRVALVTGEERIVPPGAAYFLCTVESMPLSREVAFLAIDEVQLAADPERGHIFTDRILNARGYAETMLMGSDSMAGALRRLLPGCVLTSRPRLSRLLHAGVHKITRLPRRSAVVAFSAEGVYGIAELLRRQRGGAAVVMGALSPRTRNAQVAMFQAGEVDHLVATDAIGMGLNMDIAHLAFGELGKFDGRRRRPLSPAELGQIAGRAGRHMADGTFGTTMEAGPLAPDLVARLEAHRFDPVQSLIWRNTALSFASVEALLESLERRPEAPGLIPVRDAFDHMALKQLAADAEIRQTLTGPDTLRLLWEICRIPNFRRGMWTQHLRFLDTVYRQIAHSGRLAHDWIAARINRLDRKDGDIETLTARIEQVRVWAYIAHRNDWLDEAGTWQVQTRSLEDRLSDALHERLIQRFVDRRTTALVRGLASGAGPLATVAEDGLVTIEGHFAGRVDGLRFRPESATESRLSARILHGAARRALLPELKARVGRIAREDSSLQLDAAGRILWCGEAVARLGPGRDALAPEIRHLHDESLGQGDIERLKARLEAWWAEHLATHLGPLLAAARPPQTIPAAVRGILFQLSESLGAVPRDRLVPLLEGLDKPSRRCLARFGVRLGTESVFLDGIASPEAVSLRALLWSLHTHGEGQAAPAAEAAQTALSGAPASLARDPGLAESLYLACGYRVLGPRVLSCARVEQLAFTARRLAREKAHGSGRSLQRLAGGSLEDLIGVLLALGFRARASAEGAALSLIPGGTRRRRQGAPPGAVRPSRRGKEAVNPQSPFAGLRRLRHEG